MAICAQCSAKFTPKPWPSTRSIYCSKECRQAYFVVKYRAKNRERSKEYQRNNRAVRLRSQRQYNNSEKGKKMKRRWHEANRKRRSAEYLALYHSDPQVRAIQRARAKSRKLLRRHQPNKKCVDCGIIEGKFHCHHKDHNPLNTNLTNLEWKCIKCHMLDHSDEIGRVWENEE